MLLQDSYSMEDPDAFLGRGVLLSSSRRFPEPLTVHLWWGHNEVSNGHSLYHLISFWNSFRPHYCRTEISMLSCFFVLDCCRLAEFLSSIITLASGRIWFNPNIRIRHCMPMLRPSFTQSWGWDADRASRKLTALLPLAGLHWELFGCVKLVCCW